MELYTASGRHLAEDYQNNYQELIKQKKYIESHSLPGRGTLIPMSLFDKIGLFDSKRYAHYMADIEFSLRARKAGYRLIVNAESVVHEYVAATGIQVEKGVSFRSLSTGLPRSNRQPT